MRVRTTWSPDQIKQAAMNRQADPTSMNNPEHARQQPAADAYMTGDPSSWAEDPHPASGTWEAEYSGGQVKRNEIGMPEMRKDTFSHPEKTASEQEQDAEELAKKASLAEKIARRMLPKTASETAVEDQAFSFMSLPSADLVATYTRLAGQDDQDQGKPWEDKKAQEEQAQEQQKQAQAQQQQEQDKQAGQMPPQFKENAEKKKEEAEAKKDDGQKEASLTLTASALSSLIADAIRQVRAQDQQGQEQQKQAQEQQAQQEQDKQACGQPVAAPQQQVSEQQMLDQMLAEGPGMMSEGDILMDAPMMDEGDMGFGPGDDVLTSLFANDESEAQEQQKQAQEQQDGQQKQASRAMGTRPTGGVPRISGGTSRVASSGGADLSALWQSAPDVRDVFHGRLHPLAPAYGRGSSLPGMPRSNQQEHTLLLPKADTAQWQPTLSVDRRVVSSGRPPAAFSFSTSTPATLWVP